MPYKTNAVVNAILNKAALDGEKISHMKLQKLLYYVCGYYVAAYDEPLIDHTFEAWDYGPVVPSVYHQFKNLGLKPISKQATEIDWETRSLVPVPIPTGDPRLEGVLDFVWTTYGKYSGLQLSDMTHAANSPWAKTRRENDGIRDADIPRAYLIEHFARFIKRSEAAVAE